MKFRPLEKLRTILQTSTGLDVMYAYDDLVFSEYGAYLFQFNDEDENMLNCYLQEDLDLVECGEQLQNLKDGFTNHNYTVCFPGKFSLQQIDQEVKINFIKS